MATGGVEGRGHCIDQRKATSVQKSNLCHEVLSGFITLCFFIYFFCCFGKRSSVRTMSGGIDKHVVANIKT